MPETSISAYAPLAKYFIFFNSIEEQHINVNRLFSELQNCVTISVETMCAADSLLVKEIEMRIKMDMSEVWKLVKPLALYYLGYYVTYFLTGTLLTGKNMGWLLQENTAVFGGICMLGGCAALLSMAGEELELQRRERKGKEREAALPHKSAVSYFLLAVYAVSALIFLNMLTAFLGLSGKSNTFQQVAENQFAVSLGMGLFLYAGISAVSEELLFRFLLFNRLKRYADKAIFGMIASSFLFAIYHGNIVQGSYAFVSGLLISLSYLYFDSFLAPVLFHGVGNAVIFISNKVEAVYNILFSPVSFAVFGIIAAAGAVFMIREVGNCKKEVPH